MSLFEVINDGFIGKVSLDEERPFVLEDFKDHRILSLCILKQLRNVDFSNAALVSDALCLCGENLNAFDPWVTEEHIFLAQHIIRNITECESLGDYLISHEDSVLKLCLVKLQKCLQENWKLYPGVVAAFQWILNAIRFPHMGRYVQEFLPFILRFSDDWQPENKVRGVEMIHHLIEECSWNTELNLAFGHDLIPKTLFPILHTRDVSVIDASHRTLILFYQKSRRPNLIAHELLPDLLNSMAINSDVYLRRAYSKFLPIVIQNSGIHVTPWLSKIVQLISHCAPYPDPYNEKTRLNILYGLTSLMDIVEDNDLTPLFGKYARDVLELLLRLVFELSKKGEMDDPLLLAAKDNLHRVTKCYNKEFLTLCHGLNDVSVNNVFNEVVKTALNSM